MSPWEKLLERPHSGGHFVQLYEADEAGLAKNVGHYLWEGLRRGEGILLVGSHERQALFSRCLEYLGADLAMLVKSGRLVCRDAEQMLASCTVEGQPEWRPFENTICQALREVRPAADVERVRVYGDMASLLWESRQFAAAHRLEQLWNKLLERSPISLFCSYSADVFGTVCEVGTLENTLCLHTHLIPADSHGMLEPALHRSMDEVLGVQAEEARTAMRDSYRGSWVVMPSAENIVLWLRKNLPAQAESIISLARDHYCRKIRTADAAD
jgi:MEDS: MEthanogen/methylotroph, DcmR Sensory domain